MVDLCAVGARGDVSQAVDVYLLSLNLAKPHYLSTPSLDLPH